MLSKVVRNSRAKIAPGWIQAHPMTRSKKAPSKAKGNETKKTATSNTATLAKPPPKQPEKVYAGDSSVSSDEDLEHKERCQFGVSCDEDREHKEDVNLC
ncbi:unnamed protein product [Cylindrotheca closterium]|uniref:Uncharacterized protein n=1 Tax=Cylindrotheca closterium TaxID=2856 RepID=A0AAD2FRZ4_9STRA|nr:unnamed protein product [Cylindrotheca closterium]